MEAYQHDFLTLATNEKAVLSTKALLFGDFTLKSGRKSPFFFQSGAFNNGLALSLVGEFLAHAIHHHDIDVDHLFGPAYKGIPLVSATAIALSQHYHQHLPWSFNRKAVKNYGEGGHFVGAPLQGNVLIIDDVLTAGTAIQESINLIQQENSQANVVAVVTLLDRCEKLSNGKSAKRLIQEKFHIPVFSLVSIHHVIEFLHKSGSHEKMNAIKKHLEKYGE